MLSYEHIPCRISYKPEEVDQKIQRGFMGMYIPLYSLSNTFQKLEEVDQEAQRVLVSIFLIKYLSKA